MAVSFDSKAKTKKRRDIFGLSLKFIKVSKEKTTKNSSWNAETKYTRVKLLTETP